MSKIACVSGITGQTGSHLAELLLENGYEVHGLIRRTSSFSTGRIEHIYDKIHLTYGDLADYSSLTSWLGDIKPDILMNMGAQSHVRVSFDIPEYTMDVTGTSVMRLLEVLRRVSPKTRFIMAASSELFGSSPPPQNEQTPFHPRSPYAVAKLAGYWATVNYREAYNMFAANAIMFNTESTRRGETFVTRKITRAATRIKLGLQDKLMLGNCRAKRDWSHNKDTVRAMLMMAEADGPDDYVICSGETHSVQEFLELVFAKLDLDWQKYVEIDPHYFRPSEVDVLCGDPTKIRTKLGWVPHYSFEDLINEMVQYDLALASREKLLEEHT